MYKTLREIPSNVTMVRDNGDDMIERAPGRWRFVDPVYQNLEVTNDYGPFEPVAGRLGEGSEATAVGDLEERVRVLEGIVSDLEVKLASEGGGGTPEEDVYPKYYRIGTQSIYYRVIEPGGFAEWNSRGMAWIRSWCDGYVDEDGLVNRLGAHQVDENGDEFPLTEQEDQPTPEPEKWSGRLSEVPEALNEVRGQTSGGPYYRLANGDWIRGDSDEVEGPWHGGRIVNNPQWFDVEEV